MNVTKGYTIAYKGLSNGSHDFEFEVGGGLFQQFESSEISNGACDVAVHLQRAESMLALDVVIHGSVVVACDRCLEDCRIPVDFDGRLLVKFSNEVQDYDGEVMWLLPAESEIDLAQYLYESIVLSLPYQRVHPDGECNPEMIERFKIITDREFADIEARTEQEPKCDEWEKLAALKEQMAQEERDDIKETRKKEIKE